MAERLLSRLVVLVGTAGLPSAVRAASLWAVANLAGCPAVAAQVGQRHMDVLVHHGLAQDSPVAAELRPIAACLAYNVVAGTGSKEAAASIKRNAKAAGALVAVAQSGQGRGADAARAACRILGLLRS
eukprot:tig00000615_g2565.t1